MGGVMRLETFQVVRRVYTRDELWWMACYRPALGQAALRVLLPSVSTDEVGELLEIRPNALAQFECD